MDKGDEAVAVKNFDEANREYGEAARLASGNAEIMFWHGVTLVTAGEVDRSADFQGSFQIGFIMEDSSPASC